MTKTELRETLTASMVDFRNFVPRQEAETLTDLRADLVAEGGGVLTDFGVEVIDAELALRLEGS